jgi:hypothetical protein
MKKNNDNGKRIQDKREDLIKWTKRTGYYRTFWIGIFGGFAFFILTQIKEVIKTFSQNSVKNIIICFILLISFILVYFGGSSLIRWGEKYHK